MQIIFFSSDLDILNEWKSNYNIESSLVCYDIQNLNESIENIDTYILIADYDSVANEINKVISSGLEYNNIIVLEKSPEIVTGKMLISRGIKAYGNSRMHSIHFYQIIETVLDGKVWTYPELTAALIKQTAKPSLSNEALELIEHRLSAKEREVTLFILEGLTNNAIASKLSITQRTVKAHVSSVFSKLHVNDRISLVLLLK